MNCPFARVHCVSIVSGIVPHLAFELFTDLWHSGIATFEEIHKPVSYHIGGSRRGTLLGPIFKKNSCSYREKMGKIIV